MSDPTNKNSPLFSIILPTYNRAKTIGEAIESVLKQDIDDWELIVVDDGSKDNSKEIISSFTDPRIKYIYQDNAERSAARNNGIKNAKGTYVCFIDSDDWFDPKHLSSFNKTILKNNSPVGVLYCGYTLKGSSVIDNFDLDKETNLFEHLLLTPLALGRICIHRDILQENKLDVTISISEDREFLIRVAKKNYPFIFSNHATYIFRPKESTAPNSSDLEKNLNTLHLITQALNEKQVSRNVEGLVLSRALTKLALAYYHKGNKKISLMYLRKAFAKKPSYKLKAKLYLLKQLLFN